MYVSIYFVKWYMGFEPWMAESDHSTASFCIIWILSSSSCIWMTQGAMKYIVFCDVLVDVSFPSIYAHLVCRVNDDYDNVMCNKSEWHILPSSVQFNRKFSNIFSNIAGHICRWAEQTGMSENVMFISKVTKKISKHTSQRLRALQMAFRITVLIQNSNSRWSNDKIWKLKQNKNSINSPREWQPWLHTNACLDVTSVSDTQAMTSLKGVQCDIPVSKILTINMYCDLW